MQKRLNAALTQAIQWWTGFACARPGRVLVAAGLLVSASLVYTSGHLGFNTNTNDMLSPHLPFRQTYHVFEREFPQYLNNILIVIDAETPEDARRAATTMAARLKSRPDLFRFVYLPLADPFLQTHALLFLPKKKLETIADRMARIQPFLGKLTHDPSLRGLFSMLQSAVKASSEGEEVEIDPVLMKVAAAIHALREHRHYRLSWQELMQNEGRPSSRREQFIIVQPYLDYGKLLPAQVAIRWIRKQANIFHNDPDLPVRIRLTGSVALSHDEIVSVTKGTGTAALLAALMVGAVLIAGLGSFRLVAATLFCLLAGLALTAAFAALAVGHLNLISIAFAVLYIGLGVDYAIHLCLRYKELKGKGMDPSPAVWGAVRDVGVSLFLCALTTAVGFYCFIPTAYVGISELGIISGTGMFISLFVTLALLPSILCLWQPAADVARSEAITADSTTATWLRSLGNGLIRAARPIRILTPVVVLAALTLLPEVYFDYDPIDLRDQNSESVQTYRGLLARHTISPSNIMVLTRNPRKVHELEYRLKQLDTVDKTISLFDFVPKNQEEKLALIEDMALILGPPAKETETPPPPSTTDQIQAMLALDHSLQKMLQRGDGDEAVRRLHTQLSAFLRHLGVVVPAERTADVAELQRSLLATLPEMLHFLYRALDTRAFHASDLPPALRRNWLSRDGTYRVEVWPRENIEDVDALRRFVASVRTVAPDATGAPVFILEAGSAVIHAFQQAFLTAIALIFVILLFSLRSLKDAMLVLLPLLLAGLLTAAAGVLLHIPFNFANVIALPLLLGIGVDNGIHMVQRFHALRRKQKTIRDLLGSSTSRAVILSALTTICGFGNLSFSPHQGTASLGQLLSLGIILTLLCTLFVLPAFLVQTDRGPQV